MLRAKTSGLKIASGLGVMLLVNLASTSAGMKGVGVIVGVSDTEGVLLIVGVSEIVGVRVMVGVSVMVGVRLGIGEGG